jgi:F-type H+-transporting ATPase subunit b
MAPLQPTGALVLAAETGGGGDSGNFLVTPGLGLMIWLLVAFAFTLWVLNKWVFPRIQQALDRRQRAIEESIDAAERTRQEADRILAEYRERLREARGQADEIVARARRAGENTEREAQEAGRARREEMLEQARREIRTETQRALQEIRAEVADLTVMATEKVTRKTLDDADQRRLVEEALRELDFSSLRAGDGRSS